MKALKDLTIQELISTEITDCPCGKIHKMPIHGLELGSNALESIGRVFQELTITRAFIICDQNTKQASFPLLLKELKKHSIPYQVFEFPEFHLEPDEQAVGSLIMAFDKSCDGILAVGSGVINDLAKVLASISERPLVTLATAASMDGYASNNASMIQNNLKVSLYYECADVVIADTRILAASPPDLLRAGLGDMLAKYTSICEWRISHLVTGEYYCENVADLVRHSLKRILDLADDLLTGDLQAVEEVFLGLYKTGLAMGYAGISRPASGLEHYFSHVWELMNLQRGKPSALHGIQVALGTLYTVEIWQKLKKYRPDPKKARSFVKNFDQIKWENMVTRVYGHRAADEIINTATKEGRNSPAQHANRLNIIVNRWDDILQIVEEELPVYEDLLSIMKKFSLPLTPHEIGMNDQDAYDALLASREVRNKYVTSSLMWDLGILYEIEFPHVPF